MNILIAEDPRIIPIVVEILEIQLSELEGNYHLIIAPSAVEARAQLAKIDLAIIDIVAEGGRELAYEAVNIMHIPVIATGALPESLLPKDNDMLRFILKPAFDLKKLRKDIIYFICKALEQDPGLPFNVHGFGRN